MEKAAFRFLGYKFTKIAMDFSDVATDEELSVSISTSGVYMANGGRYDLNFVFIASNPNNGNDVIKIECLSHFVFSSIIAYEDIPNFFGSSVI